MRSSSVSGTRVRLVVVVDDGAHERRVARARCRRDRDDRTILDAELGGQRPARGDGIRQARQPGGNRPLHAGCFHPVGGRIDKSPLYVVDAVLEWVDATGWWSSMHDADGARRSVSSDLDDELFAATTDDVADVDEHEAAPPRTRGRVRRRRG